jgi:hypothetical protein
LELVQRVKGNVLATRNQLVFAEPLMSEILKEPIDSGLFEKYPSFYPKGSPVPQENKSTERQALLCPSLFLKKFHISLFQLVILDS